jgi:hypothetical protein
MPQNNRPRRRPNHPPTKRNELPHWEDDPVRELTFLGRLVKHLAQPAPIQQLVFREFQKRGWCTCIENPLPRRAGKNPKQDLWNVIKNLNRHQHFRGVEFFADGTGRHICWRARVHRQRATPKLPRKSS